MVHLFHHVSELTTLCMTLTRDISWINIQVSPRNLLGWSRLDPKKHADKRKHKVGSRYLSQSSSSEEDQSSVPMQRSSKPSRAPSDQDQPQQDLDPLFYVEVAMADLSSQYPLNMLRKWTPLGVFFISLTPGKPSPGLPLLFWANRSLGQEDLLLCSPLPLTSKMPLISLSMISWPLICLRVNMLNPLPPLQSGTRGGQPCNEDKIQELNTDFSKICISPKPYGQGSPTSS